MVDFLAAFRVDRHDAQPVRVDVLLLDGGEHLADLLGQLARFAAVLRFEDGGVDRRALGDRRVGRQPGVGFAARSRRGASAAPAASASSRRPAPAASSCSAVTPGLLEHQFGGVGGPLQQVGRHRLELFARDRDRSSPCPRSGTVSLRLLGVRQLELGQVAVVAEHVHRLRATRGDRRRAGP